MTVYVCKNVLHLWHSSYFVHFIHHLTQICTCNPLLVKWHTWIK